jgi:SagB-type dehydrogenase family enzyme
MMKYLSEKSQRCFNGIVRLFLSFFLTASACAQVQDSTEVKLNQPDKTRGFSLMNALNLRASVRNWAKRGMDMQDLSDLLWAANGINRAEKSLRTTPSAHNAKDIDLFVFTEEGVYFYNPEKHSLSIIKKGDFRSQIGKQNYVTDAPLSLILVSDIKRFKKADKKLCLNWAALDAGMVSQNISLFCASANLGTVPRTFFDEDKIRKVLELSPSQHVMLHHPVGYLNEN